MRDIQSVIAECAANSLAVSGTPPGVDAVALAKSIAGNAMAVLLTDPEALLIAAVKSLPLAGHGGVTVNDFGGGRVTIAYAIDGKDEEGVHIASEMAEQLSMPPLTLRVSESGNTYMSSESDNGLVSRRMVAALHIARKAA